MLGVLSVTAPALRAPRRLSGPQWASVAVRTSGSLRVSRSRVTHGSGPWWGRGREGAVCHLPRGPSSWGLWSGAGRGRGACVGLACLPFSSRGWRAGASSEAWSQPRLHLVPQASQSPACGYSGLRRLPSLGTEGLTPSGGSRSKVGGWGPASPAAQADGRGAAWTLGELGAAAGAESAPVPPAASCAWAEMACSARSCTAW